MLSDRKINAQYTLTSSTFAAQTHIVNFGPDTHQYELNRIIN